MSHESDLQTNLLLVAPTRFPDLRLFRRNIGKARLHGYVVRFALPGQCDLYGITRGGIHIECELKNVGKKLDPDQVTWKTWCDEWKIPHIVLTAGRGETDQETVERWCLELEALIASLSSSLAAAEPSS
jgi:hypothetical protein